MNKNFGYADGVEGWGARDQFGSYQTLGDLRIEFNPAGNGVDDFSLYDPKHEDFYAGYRRDLNLIRGDSETKYTQNGVHYTRELVVSKPDEVIALHL